MKQSSRTRGFAGQNWLVWALLALWAAGCDQGAKEAPSRRGIDVLVTGVADAAGRKTEFFRYFAKGAIPDDRLRERYRRLMFSVAALEFTGENEAVVQVAVEDLNGQRLEEQTWTAVKEKEEWKLKTAPLPGASAAAEGGDKSGD